MPANFTDPSPKPSSVHILTHIMREGPKDGEPSRGPAGPLYGVHVDQSVSAARGVAERWLGDAAEELMSKPRFQIINVSLNNKPPNPPPSPTNSHLILRLDSVSLTSSAFSPAGVS